MLRTLADPRLPPLGKRNQLWFATGSMAFTILERMLILYLPFFYLPPEELGLTPLLSQSTHLGFFTALGGVLLWGRLVDGVADPFIAHLSDKSTSSRGRRRLFLLGSAVPLALCATLAFFPPGGEDVSRNALWLALVMGAFYLTFTAYVNPYLALISELGRDDSGRIDLASYMALFGLMGMVLVTIGWPALVQHLQGRGFPLRSSYQLVALGFGLLAACFLYMPTRFFRENRSGMRSAEGMWASLRTTLSFAPFRVFVLGEVFLQFAMNILTLGLLYYTVVIFRREPAFLTVLSTVTMGLAMVSFPVVNALAKSHGKKPVITGAVFIFAAVSLALFFIAQGSDYVDSRVGLTLFGLAGIPLAVLVILINPSVAEMARADALRGQGAREAMFFAARAIPLKGSIAAAGVVFGYLLTLGKDIANPQGIHLSLLVVAVAATFAFLAFRRYPEAEVKELIRQGEERLVCTSEERMGSACREEEPTSCSR